MSHQCPHHHCDQGLRGADIPKDQSPLLTIELVVFAYLICVFLFQSMLSFFFECRSTLPSEVSTSLMLSPTLCLPSYPGGTLQT